MADYKGIKGFKVQSLASDPTLVEGQVWYNTTGNVLKYQAVAAGTWASGGALNTSRAFLGTAGTQTAGIVMGGYIDPPATVFGETETYDGSAWTEVADLNTDRQLSNGAGTQTAALVAAGFLDPGYSALTEEYNGTSWAEVADLNLARLGSGGCGTQTAALNAGGGTQTVGANTVSEEFDGTSWAEGNNLNTGRQAVIGTGIQTDALMMGGTPGTMANTESYNGTCWTAQAAFNTARYWASASSPPSAGSSALLFSGQPPTSGVTNTESYDGSAWTEVNDLATARWRAGGFGSSTLAVCTGGSSSPTATMVTTEEWDATALAVKTVTVS
jgi:hypothetical protein